jgi:cation:H+ antiporter
MPAVILTFAFAVVVVVIAGTILTLCADSIAEHTGLGKLFVGSVFLAAATSLPELTTGLNAIWLDLPDLAVGDLLGSCLLNLLILAGVDLVYRSRLGVLSRVAAAHSLSGMVTIALSTVAAIGIVIEPKLVSPNILGLGPAAFAIMLGYLMGVRLIYIDQQVSLEQVSLEEGEGQPRMGAARISLRVALLGYLAAVAAVFLVAPMLAENAGRIAEISGLGETFIGSTLLALTTSLPELVATIVAVRIGVPDLAVGNIFGSNALNIAVLVPLDLAFPGSLLQHVDVVHAFTCLAVTLVTVVIVVGQLYRVERRIMFIEPDAGIVILLIVVSLWLLYMAG